MNGHEIDVWIESGRRHAQSWGSAGDPLVLCAPGLTTNMHSFDALGPELVGLARHVVAVDRGRGHGERDRRGRRRCGRDGA